MDFGGRARLTLLGGLRGAGKTTWLRHQLRSGAIRGALALVDEAAPIDEGLWEGAALVAAIADGCAGGELIGLLRDFGARRAAMVVDGQPIDRIVVETSALADPFSIVEAIRDDRTLEQWLDISEVIVIVDAVHGLGQLRRERLARRQVEAADCLVLAKTDEADAAQLARLLETLHMLNRRAPLFGAIRGIEAPLPSFDEARPEALPDACEDEGGAPVSTTTLDVEPADWPAFAVWLSALLHARGEDVLRVKGIVRAPGGRLLVQAIHGAMQAPKLLPEPGASADGTIVVIGRGYASENLRRSLRAFCLATRDAP
jgi:G3E family GTPase